MLGALFWMSVTKQMLGDSRRTPLDLFVPEAGGKITSVPHQRVICRILCGRFQEHLQGTLELDR
jgi:hypothetical protein